MTECKVCGDRLTHNEIAHAYDVGTEQDGIHCGPCLAAELAREKRDDDLANGTDSFEEYEA